MAGCQQEDHWDLASQPASIADNSRPQVQRCFLKERQEKVKKQNPPNALPWPLHLCKNISPLPVSFLNACTHAHGQKKSSNIPLSLVDFAVKTGSNIHEWFDQEWAFSKHYLFNLSMSLKGRGHCCWRDGSVVKRTSALAEEPNSVPSAAAHLPITLVSYDLCKHLQMCAAMQYTPIHKIIK